MTAAASSRIASNEIRENNHKLTRVVSTKLSIEDDDLLRQIATLAYQKGDIKEPSKSEIVRLFITLGLSAFRKEQSSLLQKYTNNKPGFLKVMPT
jgi:hypothetical protein